MSFLGKDWQIIAVPANRDMKKGNKKGDFV